MFYNFTINDTRVLYVGYKGGYLYETCACIWLEDAYMWGDESVTDVGLLSLSNKSWITCPRWNGKSGQEGTLPARSGLDYARSVGRQVLPYLGQLST